MDLGNQNTPWQLWGKSFYLKKGRPLAGQRKKKKPWDKKPIYRRRKKGKSPKLKTARARKRGGISKQSGRILDKHRLVIKTAENSQTAAKKGNLQDVGGRAKKEASRIA